MENGVKERIKIIFEKFNENPNSFAGGNKAVQRTLNRQINEGKSLSFKTILSILKKYGSVSAEWLLTGNGEMLKSESAPANIDAEYIVGILEENRQMGKKLAAANDEIRRLKKAIGEMGASKKKAIINEEQEPPFVNAL